MTTPGASGIDVFDTLSGDRHFLAVGQSPTNCAFAGRSLIVTDAGDLADPHAASFDGTLWQLDVDARGQRVESGLLA